MLEAFVCPFDPPSRRQSGALDGLLLRDWLLAVHGVRRQPGQALPCTTNPTLPILDTVAAAGLMTPAIGVLATRGYCGDLCGFQQSVALLSVTTSVLWGLLAWREFSVRRRCAEFEAATQSPATSLFE